jgi:secreted trypsin-like serine protease
MHDSILKRYLFRANDPARSRNTSTSDLRYEDMEPRSMMCASPALMDSSPMVEPVVSEHHDVAPMDGTISRIVNGTVTTQYPSVGLIGDNTGFFCSGTLISPRYVLTAAHCAEGVSATAGRFKLGSQVYSTTQVFVHPGYSSNLIGSDNANDIAIYKLDRDVVGITPSSIFRATPVVGQLLTLVGFGAGGTGNSGHDGSFGTKRVGTTPIDQVSSKLIYWNFDNNSESNTAPGDSGGPAFVNVNGTYFVAGVTSGGDQANAGIGDRSFDTRVDAYAAWIDSIIGTSTATPFVSISAVDNVAAETAAGQTANPASFTISRTGSTASSLTVTLTTGGTATNGTDYTVMPAKVTIPAGATSTTISLTPSDDIQSEGTETVIVSLVAGTGYQVNSSSFSATMSILDNDAALWNNNFANRFNLSGGWATATGTNVNATKESGEPNVLNVSGGKSVWWKWTAPVSGTVTISTAGSNFDTTLGVYTGTSVNGLSLVRANDDQNLSAGVYTSRVSFSAVAGRQYQILVDGYDGDSGSVKLTIDQPTGRKATPPKSLTWDYRWPHLSAWPNLHRNDAGVWDVRSAETPVFSNSRFINNTIASRVGSGVRDFGFANRWRDVTAGHGVTNTIDQAFSEQHSHELWDVFDEVA